MASTKTKTASLSGHKKASGYSTLFPSKDSSLEVSCCIFLNQIVVALLLKSCSGDGDHIHEKMTLTFGNV